MGALAGIQPRDLRIRKPVLFQWAIEKLPVIFNIHIKLHELSRDNPHFSVWKSTSIGPDLQQKQHNVLESCTCPEIWDKTWTYVKKAESFPVWWNSMDVIFGNPDIFLVDTSFEALRFFYQKYWKYNTILSKHSWKNSTLEKFLCQLLGKKSLHEHQVHHSNHNCPELWNISWFGYHPSVSLWWRTQSISRCRNNLKIM